MEKRLEKAAGFPKKAGLIDLQVARFSSDYIEWELDHPELTTEALGMSGYYDGLELSPKDQRKRYRAHVERELTGSMQILDQAVGRIKIDHAWPELHEVDWTTVEYQDGFFREDGTPAFFGGFNLLLSQGITDRKKFPERTEEDQEYIQSFLPKMRDLGVGILGWSASVPGLLKEDGSVDHEKIGNLAESIRHHSSLGFKIDVLLHWGGDKEVLESLWPGITEFRGNGVGIDIDHPGSRELIARVIPKLMARIGSMKEVVAWDLANEPFFDLDDWSGFSLKNYHGWLKKTHGSIERLNQRWKTGYAKFADIPMPKERPRFAPGEWYDRVTFHNHRVADFFELVAAEIRKSHPDAVIHLKGQDNSSLGPLDGAVTDGIDREMLTPSATLHGLDTRPLPVTEPRMAAGNRGRNPNRLLHYDESPYGFHWLGQSFLYDYLTSLKPYRPVVDFEYHAFSINSIRVPDIPARVFSV